MAAAKLRTVGVILDELTAENAAGIGHNNPPEPTPFDLAVKAVEDVRLEAGNWLDGAAVTSQDQADWLDRLLDDARKAGAFVEATRKAEAKPFDEGKAAVQARYKPLAASAETIQTTVKASLTVWRNAIAAEARRVALVAEQEAARAAEVARKARATVDVTNLAEVEAAETLTRASEAAQREAAKAAASKPTGLRTVWTATVTDRREALRHYIITQPDEIAALVQTLADRDARGTRGNVPGVTFTSEQKAV